MRLINQPPSKIPLSQDKRNSSTWMDWFNSIYEWISLRDNPVFTPPSSEDTGSRVGTTSDSYADVMVLLDGNTYTLTEANGATPGATVIFDFSGLKYLHGLSFRADYTGSTTHYYNVELWNYDTTAWDIISTLDFSFGYKLVSILLPNASSYLSTTGTARVRFNHPPTGVGTHTLMIDYLAIIEQGIV